MNDEILKVTDLHKSYKNNPVLREISFQLSKGEALCIVGRNGCGKSTLLNIIAGVTNKDGGEISIGKDAVVGYTPQGDMLFDGLSVKDNLKFWAGAAGIPSKLIWESDSVKVLNIAEMKKKKVKDLSGGMRRRTALAVSLLKNPDLIILDEPFSGVDKVYKEKLIDFLKKQNEKSILYTSHSRDEIEGLATRVLEIESGRLTEGGTGELI